MQIVFNVGIPIICFTLCNFIEMTSFVAAFSVAQFDTFNLACKKYILSTHCK